MERTNRISAKIALVGLFSCGVTLADSGIPYTVDSIGVVGPDLVRLYEPKKIMKDGISTVSTEFFALSTGMIDTLQSAPGTDAGCIVSVSSPARSETISVLSQSCDEVIRSIESAVRLGNVQR